MNYAKVCIAILAFLCNANPKRIAVLATHKEYDHLLQPIGRNEYLAAAILRTLAPRLTMDATKAARWGAKYERR
jgi:hypothetical protein